MNYRRKAAELELSPDYKLPKYHRSLDRAHFVRTWLDGLRHRHRYRNVQTYVMFVGYPRSGHSLVAAQMTAHPNMIVSHELHALSYFSLGYRRGQLFRMIEARDRAFFDIGCKNGKYSYAIPGQWQGQNTRLTVIGDKKGGGSTRALRRDQELLDRFRVEIGLPIRIIHVVRNPYDTISRIQLRSGSPLQRAIDNYFFLCRGTAGVIRDNPNDVLTVRHEAYISDPQTNLGQICAFVGLDSDRDYLNACADTVYRSPNRTRNEIDWPSAMIAQVRKRMQDYPFLDGYQFEEAAEKNRAA